MDLKYNAIDRSAEEEGIWITYLDALLLVARRGNRKFQQASERLFRPFKKEIRLNKLAANVAAEVMIDVYAETILLEWKNVTVGGDPVPATVEGAKLILMDEGFRNAVFDASNDIEIFRLDDLENDGETLKKTSDTP